jgi:hypothetical protein
MKSRCLSPAEIVALLDAALASKKATDAASRVAGETGRMNAPTFDTLKLARKLEAAGFSPEQAAGRVGRAR